MWAFYEKVKYKKLTREDIEKNLGESVVTKQNRLNYEYKDELEIETK